MRFAELILALVVTTGSGLPFMGCQPSPDEQESTEPIEPSTGEPASPGVRSDEGALRDTLQPVREEAKPVGQQAVAPDPAPPVRPVPQAVPSNLPLRPVFQSQEALRKHSEQWLEDHNVDELTSMRPGTGLRNRFDIAPEGVLILAGIEQMNASEAKELARFDGAALVLPDLTELTPEVAAQLASWSGSQLSLESVEESSAEAMRRLSQWSGGELYLNSLKILDQESAAALSQWTGQHLHLNGLQTISAAAVKALTSWGGQKLHLGPMPRLDPQKARHLARWSGDPVDFSRVETLDTDTAEALRGRTDLNLDGLLRLDPETAAALVRSRMVLSLNGLEELTPETAQALAAWRFGNELSVSGQNMEANAARELVKWKGQKLTVTQIATLNPRTAEHLGSWVPERPASASLKVQAKELGPTAAKGLAQWKGNRLVLDLDTLSGRAAGALVAFSGSRLEIEGLDALSPAAARGLARWNGDWLILSVLMLDAKVAKALAKLQADFMSMPGLTGISDESAKALAKWDGKILRIEHVEIISEEAAEVLRNRPGKTWCRECMRPQ